MERSEAIEIVREYYPSSGKDLNEALETLIPELKESEDERIRKGLITYFNDFTLPTFGGLDPKKILVWLEKQGEQNPATCKVEPKFKVGDVIVEIKPNGYCPPVRIKYIDEGAYSCKSDDGKRFLSFPIISQDEYKLVEQNSAWSEEDEVKLRDVIRLVEQGAPVQSIRDHYTNWLKSLRPQNTWEPSDEQMAALNDAISSRDIKYDILSGLWKDLKKLKG